MSRSRVLALVLCLCSACAALTPRAQDSLPPLDPSKFVPKPENENDIRIAVRRLNVAPEDPSRRNLTEAPWHTVEKLGRTAIPYLAEELRFRGILQLDLLTVIKERLPDPLLVPALLATLDAAMAKGKIAKIDDDVVDPKEERWLKDETNHLVHACLTTILSYGRRSVPYLVECLKSPHERVQTLGFAIIVRLYLFEEYEQEYRSLLETLGKAELPRAEAIRMIVTWWEEKREKLGWDAKSYSFKDR